MATIGSSIDPRLFVQDYGAVNAASRQQGAGMARAAGKVGNAIGDFADEQKEIDQKIKGAETIMKYAEMRFPGEAESIGMMRNQMADPSLSPRDRAAIADQVEGALSLGIGESRYQQEMKMRQAAADKRGGSTESAVIARFFGDAPENPLPTGGGNAGSGVLPEKPVTMDDF